MLTVTDEACVPLIVDFKGHFPNVAAAYFRFVKVYCCPKAPQQYLSLPSKGLLPGCATCLSKGRLVASN